MKKYICFILLALVATCCLSSCEEVKGSPEEFQKKDKTVLVYMVANNDLSGNAITNFTDMQKGYVPSEDGNLVVYYHYPNQNPLLLNIYNNESGMVAIDTVYRFPARNSATPASLTSAINVTATYFPADEYGLILWSHATGWLPSGYYANNPKSDAGQFGHSLNGAFEDPYADIVKMVKESDAGILSRSFGSEAGSEIDLKDLVKALPFKFSFVIFDACLMGGIEVAYQFKDSTDYILFSPTETLAAGMPYSSIMTHLFKTPSDLTAVAQEYFNYYNYQSYLKYATITLVKCSELDNVAVAAKEIYDAHRDKIPSLEINGIQKYYRSDKHWFYDLVDFIDHIAEPSQAAAFKETLDKAVVYKAATPYFIGIPITKYSGLSTYIPYYNEIELDNYYKGLNWNIDCGMIQ